MNAINSTRDSQNIDKPGSKKKAPKLDFVTAKVRILARFPTAKVLLERTKLLSGAKPSGPDGYMIRCPIHGTDDTPSCSVSYDPVGERVGFYCFGCKRHGNAVDLIAWLNGVDPSSSDGFRKALELSSLVAGVDLASCTKGPGRPSKTISAEQRDQLLTVWGRALPVDSVPEGRTEPVWYRESQEYLARRGLDRGRLVKMVMTGGSGQIFGLPLPLVGILSQDESGQVGSKPLQVLSRSDGTWGVTGHTVVVPMFKPGGAISSLVGRSVGGIDPKSVTATGVSPDGAVFCNRIGLAFLMGRDRATETWGKLRAGKPELPEWPRVYISEGEIDFLTVAQHPEAEQAIVLGVKSGGWNAEVAGCIPTGSEVYVLTHSDESGCGYRDQICPSLAGRKIYVRHGGEYTAKKNPDENDLLLADRAEYSPSVGCVPYEVPKESGVEKGGEDSSLSVPDQILALVHEAEPPLIRDHATGDSYILLREGPDREAVQIESGGAKNWIQRRWQAKNPGRTVTRGAIDSVIQYLGAEASRAPRTMIYRRVGESCGRILIDLCDGSGEAIQIGTDGKWGITSQVSCVFSRPPSGGPLPRPVRVPDEDKAAVWGEFFDLVRVPMVQRPEVVGALLSYMLPTGPYPLLVLSGEKGSGKSGAARILRDVVDPSGLDLLIVPDDADDLISAAKAFHVMAFDNLSSVPGWLSDLLCVFSTGGARIKRKLYTNSDPAANGFQRPVILTGIPDLATRGDLADRSICIHLDRIPSGFRRTEAQVMSRWASLHPRILGILCDGIGQLLKNGPADLANPPRMADFYCRAEGGIEAAGWPSTSVTGSYRATLAEKQRATLEASPLPRGLEAILDPSMVGPGENPLDPPAPPEWSGSMADLLARIRLAVDREDLAQLPKNAKQLEHALRRIRSELEVIGIRIEKGPLVSGIQRWKMGRVEPFDPMASLVFVPRLERNP